MGGEIMELRRRIRVCVDTSVFGGAEDPEFAEHSRRFLHLVDRGDYIVLMSEESLREIDRAPEIVQRHWKRLPEDSVEEVLVDTRVSALAEEYVRAGVLGRASLSDATHVAAAAVAEADLILSWNFRHIVNFNRIRGFNGVNIRLGYQSMTILSPHEVTGNEEEL